MKPVFSDITKTGSRFSCEIKPWMDVIFAENPYLPYLMAALLILVILLICMRNKKKRSKNAKCGGYRNFQGDIWYPDGRIWHEKSKTWEEPDYQNNKDTN